ncbi:hypothetical protein [Actinokineospora sp. NBRC 105648]|uniref:hypothetical protein n=1 Tax=Actinokineospora sp. NBRC 105648 TaxID=3032206 RepID=UPI0024A1CFEE|nr:hypothetical protein [Actinokineospora sp. NBRC 105648]GLZ42823.1 NACHT domain-containing protein [Actinokineospora sp. NBRC 105648]
MSRKVVVVVGLLLAGAGLTWWVLRVTLIPGSARTDASGYGQFVLAAIGLVIALIPVLRDWAAGDSGQPRADELADLLANAVREQWTAAAADRGLLHPRPLPIRWRRSTRAVAGPVTAATSSQAGGFDPLPGLDRVTQGMLCEGTDRDLHRIYGGLASGRVIITGQPGSGKSSTAILLLLEALAYRDRTPENLRSRVPVPVLFTLSGWDPNTTAVHDWLVGKLGGLTPFVRNQHRTHASHLLATGRIAVFLDGLDEMDAANRSVAVRALAGQSTFRLVLLTRTEELVGTAEQYILTSAATLELQALTRADALTYLRHSLLDPPPSPWRKLLNVLASNNDTPFTAAVDNPLTITLIRDIYQVRPLPDPDLGDPGELLDIERFATPAEINRHLLDRAITVAYTPKPGHVSPPYSSDTAVRALTVLAEYLRDDNTRDLRWWRIPGWGAGIAGTLTHGAFASLVFGLAGGVVFGLTGSLTSAIGLGCGLLAGFICAQWDMSGVVNGAFGGLLILLIAAATKQITNALVFGFIGGLTVGLITGLSGGVRGTCRPANIDMRMWTRTLRSRSFLCSTAIGAGFGFFSWRTTGPAGAISMLAGGVMAGLMYSLGHDRHNQNWLETTAEVRTLGRSELLVSIIWGVLAGLAFIPILGVMAARYKSSISPSADSHLAIMCALAGGVAGGLTTSTAWSVWVNQLHLASKHRIPIRLIAFIEDAHKRRLLRSVGPIYQFRHASLQDHLAPPCPHDDDSPKAAVGDAD